LGQRFSFLSVLSHLYDPIVYTAYKIMYCHNPRITVDRARLPCPGQIVKKVGLDGTLDGGAVLPVPGFTLAVKDIFPD
jgi:hypothetical protein